MHICILIAYTYTFYLAVRYEFKDIKKDNLLFLIQEGGIAEPELPEPSEIKEKSVRKKSL